MTDTDSHRHGCKAVSRLQVFRPVRLDFRRAAHSQVKVAVLISNFIMPGTAVVNLKKQARICCAVPNISHRNIFLRRPVTRICNLNRLRCSLIVVRLRLRHAKICKAVFFHRQLLLPAIVNHYHRHLII